MNKTHLLTWTIAALLSAACTEQETERTTAHDDRRISFAPVMAAGVSVQSGTRGTAVIPLAQKVTDSNAGKN